MKKIILLALTALMMVGCSEYLKCYDYDLRRKEASLY